MKWRRLNEDKLPSRLYVVFSSEITNRIDTIGAYNRGNISALTQWYDYLEGIKRYISNPVIAWDYTNRYPQFPNGAKFIRDFDFNVAYVIKTNRANNLSYVYIFKVNLNLEEYGLKNPPYLTENKKIIRLTESDLHRIVKESVKKVLLELKNNIVP